MPANVGSLGGTQIPNLPPNMPPLTPPTPPVVPEPLDARASRASRLKKPAFSFEPKSPLELAKRIETKVATRGVPEIVAKSTEAGKIMSPTLRGAAGFTARGLGALAAHPVTMVGSVVVPAVTNQAESSGQVGPTQVATQTRTFNKETDKIGAPISTGAISFTDPRTGMYTPKITNTSMSSNSIVPTPEPNKMVVPPITPLNLPATYPMPPKAEAAAVPIALPSIVKTPTQQFEPQQLEAVKNFYGDALAGVNSNLDKSTNIHKEMLDARLATMPMGSSNPLGAIAAANQMVGLADRLAKSYDNKASINANATTAALPTVNSAYTQGDELRKKQIGEMLQADGKLRELMGSPLTQPEIELRKAQIEESKAKTAAALTKEEAKEQERESRFMAAIAPKLGEMYAEDPAKATAAMYDLYNANRQALKGNKRYEISPAVEEKKPGKFIGKGVKGKPAVEVYAPPNATPEQLLAAQNYTPQQIADYMASKKGR
jgi:hypothetical protein